MSKKYRKEISAVVVVEWEEGACDGIRYVSDVGCPIPNMTCPREVRCSDCWAEFMKDAEEVKG